MLVLVVVEAERRTTIKIQAFAILRRRRGEEEEGMKLERTIFLSSLSLQLVVLLELSPLERCMQRDRGALTVSSTF
jgi:hypothetical protein